MSPMVSPARCVRSNLSILHLTVRPLQQEELNHRPMSIERGVMQPRSRVIKPSRHHIDLSALVQEQPCSINVAMHAGKDKGVVDDALTILRPRLNPVGQLLLTLCVEIR